MNEELLRMIENMIANGAVGVLHLGTGARARRIFSSGRELHLIDAGKECRCVPTPFLFASPNISKGALEAILTDLRTQGCGARALLEPRGLLSPEDSASLAARETTEELISLIERCTHFVFEEGSVPEELILPSARTVGVPFETFAVAIGAFQREAAAIRRTLPRDDEILRLSDRGARAVELKENWAFREVALPVDGKREVREVVRMTCFFPHFARQALAAGVRQGWLKKTVFHEFLSLDPFAGKPHEAGEMVHELEAALETAVDELPLREVLARFCLRSGDVDRAVAEFSAIGNCLRERGDVTGAAANYREALRWEPTAVVARDTLVDLFLESADRAHASGDLHTEQRYVAEALRFRRGDLDLYMRAIDSFEGNEAQILQFLPQLLKTMEQDTRTGLALAFMAKLRERFPASLHIRNKYINLLLDERRTAEAIQEMELIAGECLDQGRKKEAELIYRKIAQLAPDRRESSDQIARLLRGHERRWFRPRFSKSGILALVFIASLGAYNFYTYALLHPLAARANTLVDEPVPPVGTPHFNAHMNDAVDVMRDCRSFGRVHCLSVWATFGNIRANSLQELIEFLERQRQGELTRIEDRIDEAYLRGRIQDARDFCRELIRKGDGTEWMSLGEQKLREIDEYEARAGSALAAAEEAFAQRQHERAFALFSDILRKYPRSSAARALTLPVRVSTSPNGAEITDNGRVLGTTPLLLRVHPTRSLTLQATLPGYRPETIVIEEPAALDMTVTLKRK